MSSMALRVAAFLRHLQRLLVTLLRLPRTHALFLLSKLNALIRSIFHSAHGSSCTKATIMFKPAGEQLIPISPTKPAVAVCAMSIPDSPFLAPPSPSLRGFAMEVSPPPLPMAIDPVHDVAIPPAAAWPSPMRPGSPTSLLSQFSHYSQDNPDESAEQRGRRLEIRKAISQEQFVRSNSRIASRARALPQTDREEPQGPTSTVTDVDELPLKPHLSHRWLKEMTLDGDDFPRYSKRGVVLKKQNEIVRSRLDVVYPHGGESGDWIPVTHTEGPLYFYHRKRRIYTDAYMYSEAFQNEMDEFIQFFDACDSWCRLRDGRSPLQGDRELVVELGSVDTWKEDGPINWKYYIVDHESRSIIWLRKLFVSSYMDKDVQGADSPAHFHHLCQSWYWKHWWLFPIGPKGRRSSLDRDELRRLSGTLDYFIIDGMVSPTSTNSYRTDQLRDMNDIVKHAEQQCGDPEGLTSEAMAAVARVQYWIAHWRFVNFHGQRAARISSLQSVHEEIITRPRRLFIRFFSVLLIFTPEQHLRDLEDIYVDGIVSVPAWHMYFQKLLEEWDKLILQGTVILTANISFLAIPAVLQFLNNTQSVTPGSAIQSYDLPLRSGPAILSYLSTIFGLGSIMLGLLLARHNRSQTQLATDAEAAVTYLEKHSSRRLGLGLEPLAVLHSLPYAFLLWATGTFFAALLYFALSTPDKFTFVVVLSGACIVSAFVIWYIMAAWELPELLKKLPGGLYNLLNRFQEILVEILGRAGRTNGISEAGAAHVEEIKRTGNDRNTGSEYQLKVISPQASSDAHMELPSSSVSRIVPVS